MSNIEHVAANLLTLLEKGPVTRNQIPFNGSTLYQVIRYLAQQGHIVARIDAGGHPTWILKSI